MRLLGILLIILTTTAISPAKVFISWPGRSDIEGTLSRLGGSRAYRAPVTINGGRADLSVFGFDNDPNTTVSAIRRILNLKQTSSATAAFGPSTEVYTVADGKIVSRLVLIRMPRKNRLLAIVIRQSEADYKKSLQPPAGTEIEGIPQFPGSTPHFFMENRETGLQLAISKTSAPADAVAGFYGSALSAAGWQPYLAEKGRGSIPRLAVYQRADHICFVVASASPGNRDITISVLHKTLK